jgi:hypothetical protein
MKPTYDDVVSICDAHGICLQVDCVELVVAIVEHVHPDHSGDGGENTSEGNFVSRWSEVIKGLPMDSFRVIPVSQDGDERARFEAWYDAENRNAANHMEGDDWRELNPEERDNYFAAFRAALASNKAAQDGDQRELLEALAMRLESGRLFNGIAQPNADIYARALRTVLASNKAAAVAVGESNDDLLSLLREMVDLHGRNHCVLTVHMERLAELLPKEMQA